MRPDDETVAIKGVRALRASERGLYCYIEQTRSNRWLPQSHIAPESEVRAPGDEGTLVISRWLADREELE